MMATRRKKVQDEVNAIWAQTFQHCQLKVRTHQLRKAQNKSFSSRWAVNPPQPGSMLHGLLLHQHRDALSKTYLHKRWCLMRPFIGMGVQVNNHPFIVIAFSFNNIPEWNKEITAMNSSLQLVFTLQNSAQKITIHVNVVDTFMLPESTTQIPIQQVFSSPSQQPLNGWLTLDWSAMQLTKTLDHPSLMLVGPFHEPIVAAFRPQTMNTAYLFGFQSTAHGREIFPEKWKDWVQCILVQHISSTLITYYIRVPQKGSLQLWTLLSSYAFQFPRLRQQAQQLLTALHPMHPHLVFPLSPLSSLPTISSCSSSGSNHWITQMKEAFLVNHPTLATLQVTRINGAELFLMDDDKATQYVTCGWDGAWKSMNPIFPMVNLPSIPTFVQRTLPRDWMSTFILDSTLSRDSLIVTTPWTRCVWEFALRTTYQKQAKEFNIRTFSITTKREESTTPFKTLVLHGNHNTFLPFLPILQNLSFARLVILTTNWTDSLSPLLRLTRMAAFDPHTSPAMRMFTQTTFMKASVSSTHVRRAKPFVKELEWSSPESSLLYQECAQAFKACPLEVLERSLVRLCHGLAILYSLEELKTYQKNRRQKRTYSRLPTENKGTFEATCCICLQEFPLVAQSIDLVTTSRYPIRTQCGHSFCMSCITRWWKMQRDSKNSPSCPMCKQSCEKMQIFRPKFSTCSMYKANPQTTPKLKALLSFLSTGQDKWRGIIFTDPQTVAFYARALSAKNHSVCTVQHVSTLSSGFSFLMQSDKRIRLVITSLPIIQFSAMYPYLTHIINCSLYPIHAWGSFFSHIVYLSLAMKHSHETLQQSSCSKTIHLQSFVQNTIK